MSRSSDKDKDRASVLSDVVEVTASLVVHGLGEVAAAGFNAGHDAVCTAASSAGGVIIDVAGAVAESAGDALG
jgi:hypothetical protein